VRDAAGEPPDRFHLRCLAQPVLEPLAFGLCPLLFGDVLYRSNEVDVVRFS
jgi:hypothetical protein